MARFTIAATPFEHEPFEAALRDHRAGAYATFEGWVRDHNDGRKVARLDYEAFEPLAIAEAERILDEAQAKFAIHAARAVHRTGTLQLGDRAVWIGVAASHRDEAFRACRYIIDEIKARLPVWKKEHYAGGDAIWVNCQHAAPSELSFTPKLDESQLYARQLRLPEIGEAGQAKLKDARVLIVGMGGLGSAAAPSLAAAGVGTLGLVEHDELDASNLHRQLLYSATDIGKPKAQLAAARLSALNPFLSVRVHSDRLGPANCAEILAGYDLVLDCTDNFATKYLLNDAAHLLGVPVVQASLYQYEGQLQTIDAASDGGCLRCIHPAPPPAGAVGNCAEVGVLGVVPQLFGALQAAEALKRLLGMPGQLSDATLLFDLATFETQRFKRPRRPDCALCGEQPSITSLTDVTVAQAPPSEIEVDLASIDHATLRGARWIDLREPAERSGAVPPGTLSRPFGGFDADAPGFEPGPRTFLFCAAGRRSLRAAQKLRARGWSDVWSVRGGADAVRAILTETAE
ncbi:MAG: molybdopterin converting factor [Rhodospirillales bacterium]|nr:molybdopterin converting factor [Rhodospirillales bacterium]